MIRTSQPTRGGRLRRKARSFLGWPPARRALVLEAALALTLSSLRLRLRPFARIAATLGPPRPADAGAEHPPVPPEACHVAEAVEMASRTLPWSPRCLAQALAAKRLLDRRGIDAALYVGVRPGLEAHAWLAIGSDIILGADEAADFDAVAVFG